MSSDPRIEAAARDVHPHLWNGKFESALLRFTGMAGHTPEQATAAVLKKQTDALAAAAEYLAAADKVAPITTYTGAQVNKAGWVCGVCEPGDYAKCDDCQSACDDVAQFVNRLIGGTE